MWGRGEKWRGRGNDEDAHVCKNGPVSSRLMSSLMLYISST